jgi:hypothetical protein
MPATTKIENWQYQDNYVERIMDDAAYTAAHPDDTLVVIGPPRFSMISDGAESGKNTLYPIGMLQAFQAAQNKPVVPMQTIGSGRSFFLAGKSSITWSMGRLFVKGKNLIRALHNNAIEAGIKVADFDEPIQDQDGENTNYFINLDSELLLIPFGMGVLFRDKSHNQLGGFYMELCCMNSWVVGLNAGQNMIMENVNGMCDRIRPWHHDTVIAPHPTSTEIDEAIGFTDAGTNQ